MRWIFKIAANVLSLMVVATLLPGVEIVGWWAAVVAAVVIGLVNTFLKPVLVIITLPVTILTFGIFAVVLNILLLMLVAAIVPGFEIQGFLTAFFASLLLSFISWFLSRLSREP